jgi:hypothetical protein
MLKDKQRIMFKNEYTAPFGSGHIQLVPFKANSSHSPAFGGKNKTHR